ncbi:MAG: dTMP kinase [Fidelibacterota bacterium]
MKKAFITFEGIDGCGKSTQAELLKTFLEEIGQEVILVREPGGTEISEQIRTILLDPDSKAMEPTTETILLAASRSQLIRQVIVPSINQGKTVLCDRYVDSTLAYQGFGRGLPIEWLKKINEFATGGTRPDATILVDIPVKTAMERLGRKSFDRMEGEGHKFLQKVRAGYLTLAQKEPARYIVIKGTKSIDKIHHEIISRLGGVES